LDSKADDGGAVDKRKKTKKTNACGLRKGKKLIE